MSELFPPVKKGVVLRIYYSRPWKNAYVFLMNGMVTHASNELAFTIGWPHEKVVARAEKVGFSVSRQMNVFKPRDTWLSARPAPVQVPLPYPQHKFVEPDLSFMTVPQIPNMYSAPPIFSTDVPTTPKRDSKGRFISTKPKKKRKP